MRGDRTWRRTAQRVTTSVFPRASLSTSTAPTQPGDRLSHKLTKPARWWRYGRHSGYPRCCIVYFVARALLAPKAVKTWSADRAAARPGHPGYVRCPICRVRGRRVVQHICDQRCHDEPGHACYCADEARLWRNLELLANERFG